MADRLSVPRRRVSEGMRGHGRRDDRQWRHRARPHRVLCRCRGGQPADRGALHIAGRPDRSPIDDVDLCRCRQDEIAHVPAAGCGAALAPAKKCAPRSTGSRAMRACACTRRCICSPPCCPIRSPAARSARRKAGSISTFPEAGLDKDEIDEAARRDDRRRRRGHERAGSPTPSSQANPGLVKTMAVKPPMGTGRVRLIEIEGLRSAALRRHACRAHRRDRRRAGDADREEGQAEPTRAHSVSYRPHCR